MPTTQLQLRRGTTAQTAIFTGAVGEVTVDTDKKTLIVHDGITAGGTEIAKESYANAAFHQANNASSTASDAFQHASSAGSYANSAYTQANTATTNAATADQKSVSAGVYANSAFDQANTGTQYATSAGVYANAAFDIANTAVSDLSSANTWLQSYVNTQITNLVDSAPTTLDTLNELAAALNDDANFATTVTNTIAAAGSYANSAYSQANTATTNAATADQRAVTSGSYANSAYALANTANAKVYIAGSTLSTNTANQTIDSYSTTEYRTAKYIVQAISGADVHSEELLVTHNDTDVFFTEYAIVTTANSLFNVYATIQSANVTVNVSPVNAETQVDFSRISIVARTLASLEGDLMSLSGTEDLGTGSGTVDLMA